MFRKDYLLRYIEQLGEVLAVLFNMKKKGHYEEAMSFLERTFEEMLEFNHQDLKAVSGKFLIEKYSDADLDKLSAAAELFYERGNIFSHLGEEAAAKDAYKISLDLMEYVHANDLTYSISRVSQIQAIKNELDDLP